MFWGLTILADKEYTQTVEDAFHLSQACLPFDRPADLRLSVLAKVDGQVFTLATLEAGKTEQVGLNLIFNEGQEVSFSITAEDPKVSVDLCGYFLPDENMYGDDDDEDMYDEQEAMMMGSSDEEEEEVDSDSMMSSELLALAKKNAQKNAKIDEIDEDEAEKIMDLLRKRKFNAEEDGSDFEIMTDDDEEIDSDMAGSLSEGDDDEEEEEEEEEEEKENAAPPAKKQKKEETAAPVAEKKAVKKDAQENKKAEAKKAEAKKAEAEKAEAKKAEAKKAEAKKAEAEKAEAKKAEAKKAEARKAEAKKVEAKKEAPKKFTKAHGVMCEEVKEGNGKSATRGKNVSVYYKGWLASNNKVFDSCEKGRPFTFRLGNKDVIKGWDIGVEGMKIGGRRKLKIPAKMAYGNQKIPGIPPNSTLCFEVQLMNVQ